jgi:hypothetical protein
MTGFLKNLLSKEEAKTITIVSGLPRSGTSMMMKMLETGGIPPLTDELRTADSDNPRGYYEFERVKRMDKGDTEWLSDAEGKSVKVISALLKHLPGEYQYQVIFMKRSMAEILASQRKMLDRRGEDSDKMDDDQMAMLFHKHLTSVEQWLAAQSNMSVLEVNYREVLDDPLAQIERLNRFLGGQLDRDNMVAVVDPVLYRNREQQLQ